MANAGAEGVELHHDFFVDVRMAMQQHGAAARAKLFSLMITKMTKKTKLSTPSPTLASYHFQSCVG